ncbi:MAG: flippase [Patescibacteria group bacterium]|nr:flippase [Patescibacteria group bacterium]
MIQRIKSFLFENITTNQTIAKNTFWMVIGQILSKLIKAILLVYAARVMGTTEWGTFSYVLSLAGLFTIFMDFGVNAIVTRESTRDLEQQKVYFSTAFIVKLVAFVVIAAAVFVLGPYFINQSQVLVLVPLAVIMLGLDGLRDFGASLSRAWERMEIESFIQVFTNAMVVIAGMAALYIARTAQSLTWGYIIGVGLGTIAAFYPFRSYFKNLWRSFDKKIIKKILASSWPFGMLGVMGAIMLNTDTIMVGWYRSIDDVGFYGAAQRVIQLIYLIPGLLAIAFFPAMSRAIKDLEIMKKLIEGGTSLLSLFAIPLTVGGVLLANDVTLLVYGSSYMPAAGPFRLLCLTFLPAFLAAMFGNAIFALNKEKKLFVYVVIGILGNFIFNLLFIPIWGISGAALSTVCNQIILTLYLIYFLRKELHFRVLHQVEKLVGATIIMGLALLGLRALGVSLYINVFVGLGVYTASLLLFKEQSALMILNKLRGLKQSQ